MSTAKENLGIVVGADGSPSAKVALYWAAQEAAMRDVALTIVHVVTPMVPNWPGAAARVEYDQWQLEQARVSINEAVRIVEESVTTGRPLRIDHEIFVGTPVSTLVDLSKEAQMVVVGCRGRGAVPRLLLGSVSSGLVHHAHCPVAVIHDEDPLMPHPSTAPVLLGIDGSPASESATAIAFEEADRRGVDLIAVHAWQDTDALDLPIDWAVVKSQEELALAERLAGWQERYPDVTVDRRLVHGGAARYLIEKSERAQLVVVGSHGRGGFAGMLLGSVSSAVVQGCRMPVIVARQS